MPADPMKFTIHASAPSYKGCVVRVEEVEPSKLYPMRKPAPYVDFARPGARTWMPAPLRAWATAFPKHSPLWVWLKSHGVRRPSPSGTRTSGTPRARRAPSVEVTLSDVGLAKLDQGEATGLSRSQCVDAALRAWQVPR